MLTFFCLLANNFGYLKYKTNETFCIRKIQVKI